MFSPGSDGFSARSQLGGSPGSGSILPANRKEESRGWGGDETVCRAVHHSLTGNRNQFTASQWESMSN